MPIGIRLALGAPRSTIVSLIASQLFWPTLAGGVLGLGFGTLATSLIEVQSQFIGHADGVVFGSGRTRLPSVWLPRIACARRACNPDRRPACAPL